MGHLFGGILPIWGKIGRATWCRIWILQMEGRKLFVGWAKSG
jgi:hypothetical protein